MAYECKCGALEALEADPTFNISGWNDSYTGALVPADQVREWVDTTVARILALGPDRVLEIGCGTGLLLFRVAPHCSYYCASDIAPNALCHIMTHKDHFAGDWSVIDLREGAADDFDGLDPGTFDTVVINSVVQLFPSIHYLVDVLEKVVDRVKPGGTVFVGDVRNHTLLEAFHASIQWHQAPGILSRAKFRRRVQRSMVQESQLVIDPAFFTALQRHLPAISQVEIQLRRGDYSNEMNRFRYDAILHIGKDTAPSREDVAKAPLPPGESLPRAQRGGLGRGDQGGKIGACWRDWQDEGLTQAWVRKQLTEVQPETLGIARIPNARLTEEMHLLAWLKGAGDAGTVSELQQTLDSAASGSGAGIEPETWWCLAEETGYTAYVDWPSGPDTRGCYDVWLQRDPTLPEGVAKGIGLYPLIPSPPFDPPLPLPRTYRWGGASRDAAGATGDRCGASPSPARGEGLLLHPLPARFAATGDDVWNRGAIVWTDYANNPLQGQVASQLEPALRRYLKEQLPDYMVPALFVTLDELPLTPNGKVDRKALPAPAKTRPRLATGWVEPRSGIERQVATIWQQVLGLDAVGTLDNFFELGGNSLLLTLVHHRLEEWFDREVPMVALFQYPTIQALARYFSASHAPAS